MTEPNQVTEPHAAPGKDSIGFEEIARLPAPGMAFPVGFAFGPGERVVTYLYAPDGSLDRRLFVLDLDPERCGTSPRARELEMPGAALREEGLPLAERLRRERARELGLGVTKACWAEGADALLVPMPDGLYLFSGLSADPSAASCRLVASAASGEIVAPKLAPDGARVAFVRHGELYVVPTAGEDDPRRITTSAMDGITNGVAEFVAQEEMDRPDGFWWSTDSTMIAYTEVDESHIPIYRIIHQADDETGPSTEETHRYPFAGQANAVVRLGVIDAGGGETVWMDTGEEDQYLARVHWLADGHLVAELETRDQATVRVVSFDPRTGASTVLLAETTEPYVNLHDDFRALAGGEWTWSSERTGFRHLEVRSASGDLVNVLTSGEWQVDRLEAVDEELSVVYFTATKDGPTERHLYSVPLKGGEIRRITAAAGTHVTTVGTTSRLYVDRHAALDSPPTVRVRSIADGSVFAVVHDTRDPRIDELGLEPPELVSVTAEDGTVLYAIFYRPVGNGGPPPLAVNVYGGPHAQLAVNDWGPTAVLRAQALRRNGIGVMMLDNRGSARRGLGFEKAIWHNMGALEVADQVRGVKWAVAQGLADPTRVGIYGWSYGGYMTLRCLALASDTFRAGVAGAPVTDWGGYDTHYTERYMGTPLGQPGAFESSSVLSRVGDICGELLIVHGLIDENVHFRHTARLINSLVHAKKPYQLLCFPDERHSPRRAEDRAFMEQQVIGWLQEALGHDS
ncbi:MAG: S9 family peptidase [Acidimicrobiales bacterium]